MLLHGHVDVDSLIHCFVLILFGRILCLLDFLLHSVGETAVVELVLDEENDCGDEDEGEDEGIY